MSDVSVVHCGNPPGCGFTVLLMGAKSMSQDGVPYIQLRFQNVSPHKRTQRAPLVPLRLPVCDKHGFQGAGRIRKAMAAPSTLIPPQVRGEGRERSDVPIGSTVSLKRIKETDLFICFPAHTHNSAAIN